jgi:hypothetical protein
MKEKMLKSYDYCIERIKRDIRTVKYGCNYVDRECVYQDILIIMKYLGKADMLTLVLHKDYNEDVYEKREVLRELECEVFNLYDCLK